MIQMTKERSEKYGAENVAYAYAYTNKFLPNGTATKLPETPKDIPVGTILVQHWLNSASFYKVVKTTAKTVVLVDVDKFYLDFESTGGFTGYEYVMPDFANDYHTEDANKTVYRKRARMLKDGGFALPGVHCGDWCHNLSIWDGNPVTQYYE